MVTIFHPGLQHPEGDGDPPSAQGGLAEGVIRRPTRSPDPRGQRQCAIEVPASQTALPELLRVSGFP